MKIFGRTLNPAILVTGWLVFTVSLSVWWMIHGLKQVERLQLGQAIDLPEVVKNQRMLHWEGASLIFFVIIGGVGLLYFSLREFRRHQQVQEFFATMTHELKTPLASLRLQVEALSEDLAGTPHEKLIGRLLNDSSRLELQLVNALYLASLRDSDQLCLENIPLESFLESVKGPWSEVDVKLKGKPVVSADARALEGVLKNLFQNARVHGKATKISVHGEKVKTDHGSMVRLSIHDNGQGFSGDRKKLGELFKRHTATSGSGIGLYLTKRLVEGMNGEIEFDINPQGKGFTAHLSLQGAKSEGEDES